MWNRCSAGGEGGGVSRDDKRGEEEKKVGGGQESRELELHWGTNQISLILTGSLLKNIISL